MQIRFWELKQDLRKEPALGWEGKKHFTFFCLSSNVIFPIRLILTTDFKLHSPTCLSSQFPQPCFSETGFVLSNILSNLFHSLMHLKCLECGRCPINIC